MVGEGAVAESARVTVAETEESQLVAAERAEAVAAPSRRSIPEVEEPQQEAVTGFSH